MALALTAPATSHAPFLSSRQLRAIPSALRFYRFPMPVSDAFLRAAVERNALPATAPRAVSVAGFQAFLPPEGLGRATPNDRVMEAEGYLALRWQTRVRKLPPATLKRAIQQRVAEFTELAGRPPRAREAATLHAEVQAQLLPRAPIEETEALIFLDPSRRRLALEARYEKQADTLIAQLRQAFGTFPCEPVAPAVPLAPTMTDWLTGQPLPVGFTLGSKVAMQDSQKQSVQLRNQDLETAETLEHVSAGKQVRSIELLVEPFFSLTLTDDVSFSQLRALQDIDRRPPMNPAEASAQMERVVPQIFRAASSLFQGLVDIRAATQAAEVPASLPAPARPLRLT